MHRSRRQPPSPHAAAWRGCLSRPARVLGLTLFQLALRVVALLPLILHLAGRSPLRFPREHAPVLSLLSCLPLWILLVLPFRFQAGAALAALACGGRAERVTGRDYGRWLSAALLRLLLALPFLLPLAACLGAFYYYWNMAGFNEAGILVSDLGALLGGGYELGAALVALLFLLALLTAVLGWRRLLVMEYLPVAGTGLWGARARARALFKQRRAALRRVSFKNALLCLPALLVAVPPAVYLLSSLSGDMRSDLMVLLALLDSLAFPAWVFLGMGAAWILAYLPLVCPRKAALACAALWEKGSGRRG